VNNLDGLSYTQVNLLSGFDEIETTLMTLKWKVNILIILQIRNSKY